MILNHKCCDNDGAKWEKRHETCENLIKRQFLSSEYIFSFDWQDFSLGGNREGEIPDPIPNSEVKPFIANGTVLKSMEE